MHFNGKIIMGQNVFSRLLQSTIPRWCGQGNASDSTMLRTAMLPDMLMRLTYFIAHFAASNDNLPRHTDNTSTVVHGAMRGKLTKQHTCDRCRTIINARSYICGEVVPCRLNVRPDTIELNTMVVHERRMIRGHREEQQNILDLRITDRRRKSDRPIIDVTDVRLERDVAVRRGLMRHDSLLVLLLPLEPLPDLEEDTKDAAGAGGVAGVQQRQVDVQRLLDAVGDGGERGALRRRRRGYQPRRQRRVLGQLVGASLEVAQARVVLACQVLEAGADEAQFERQAELQQTAQQVDALPAERLGEPAVDVLRADPIADGWHLSARRGWHGGRPGGGRRWTGRAGASRSAGRHGGEQGDGGCGTPETGPYGQRTCGCCCSVGNYTSVFAILLFY